MQRRYEDGWPWGDEDMYRGDDDDIDTLRQPAPKRKRSFTTGQIIFFVVLALLIICLKEYLVRN